MEFIISASTDIGNVKKTNQDSLKVMSIATTNGNIVFAILCDGMGGLAKGEVASFNVVRELEIWAKNALPRMCKKGITEEELGIQWTEIVSRSNEKIKAYGGARGVALGTTLTALLITEERYYGINIGDTRAYMIHDRAEVLTSDQTVVSREIELGLLTLEQAEVDPRRSVLLQCIGASDVVYPDIFSGVARKNVVYMLCTDGFRHEISQEEIGQYFHPSRMLSNENMKQAEMDLIQLNKQRRERDNISVITIRTY